ncbi:MAG: DUF4153 domain-containing protein [Bacteroidales bacterium]|nr:DUF4153 domain-containing protein [Bacteroidales bacterium]
MASKFSKFLSSLFSDLGTTIVQRHCESILFLLFTVRCVVNVWFVGQGDELLAFAFWLALLMPVILILSDFRQSRPKVYVTVLYYFVSAVCAGLGLFDTVIYDYILTHSNYTTTLYFTTVLQLIVTYSVSRYFKSDTTIAGRWLSLGSAYVKSGIICLIAFLLLLGIVSIVYALLYEFSNYLKIITTIYVVLASFISPLLFLMYVTRRPSVDVVTSRFFSAIVNYVLTIAIVGYIVVIYLYIIKNIFLWELPQGGVANIVMCLSLLILMAYYSHKMLENKQFGAFYDKIGLIFSPVLVMFWIGAVRRISDYGLSPARIYMVISGITLTVWVVMQILKKKSPLRTALAVCLVGLLLVTYVPKITTGDISVWSQKSRLIDFARENNALNDDGTIDFEAEEMKCLFVHSCCVLLRQYADEEELAALNVPESVEVPSPYGSLGGNNVRNAHSDWFQASGNFDLTGFKQIYVGSIYCGPARAEKYWVISVTDAANDTLTYSYQLPFDAVGNHLEQLLEKYLPGAGTDTVNYDSFNSNVPAVEMLISVNDTVTLKLSNIYFTVFTDSTEITDINADAILFK